MMPLLIAILYTFYFILAVPHVLAFTMENQSVHLELPDVLGDRVETGTQTDLQAVQENPKILAGLPKGSPLTPFSFTTSSLLVDYGVVAPTDPVARTTSLIVQQGTAFNGYAIFAIEDHPIRILQSTDEINDTTCDTGSCNQAQTAPWANPLVFGAGFRVDNIQGKTADKMFQNSQDLFAQLSDRESGESGVPIMASKGETNGRNDETRILHKVNVPGTQKEGVYQNIINYIAVPNL